MRYRDSKLIRACNVLADFCLILCSYFAAGVLRILLPLGSLFFLQDLICFAPLAVFYAAVMVLVYAFYGMYRSLRTKGWLQEGMRVGLAGLIGFALVATLLYTFRLSQFSRLLLGWFYLLSWAAILIKRKLLYQTALRYAKKHRTVQTFILLGSGPLAQRLCQAVGQGREDLHYLGYLADTPCPAMGQWLGKSEDFHQVLESLRVDQVICAEEPQSAGRIRRMVALCDSYGIQASVVPVYSDLVALGHKARRRSVGGVQLETLSARNTCDILGVRIQVTDMEHTLETIEENLSAWSGKYICVANVHTTVTAHDDTAYRAVQNGAVMALPDGGPLSAYSRSHGYTGAQRVTGPDLMRQVLARSAEKGWSSYFYGSTPETLELLQKKIAQQYPGARIAGMMSPPFRELSPKEDAEVVAQINATHPDFVWVGLGAPKQERWMAAHENRVEGLMVGVGAAFDYEAGNIKRAPAWMQAHNLEWLYRLLQDPRRLLGRYLSTNLRYLWLTWRGGDSGE